MGKEEREATFVTWSIAHSLKSISKQPFSELSNRLVSARVFEGSTLILVHSTYINAQVQTVHLVNKYTSADSASGIELAVYICKGFASL